MTERLSTLILLLAIHFVVCTIPTIEDEKDYSPEFRGFDEYETWKPSGHHHSPPEVILIKHKDPHADSMHHSIGSVIKHHLPLLAVIAPLVAVSILLPLKAYFGPSYVVYPPVTPAAPAPAPPPSMRDRVGKVENENFEELDFAAQLLNMIEEIDKVYGEMTNEDKDV